MTTPSDRDQHQHPDVEEIADLSEGLLPQSRALAVREHLDGCALCTDVHRSLTEVRDILGSLPAPAPMPADIAERIDAALAAESVLGASLCLDGHTRIPSPSTAQGDARSRPAEAPVVPAAPLGAAANRANTAEASAEDGAEALPAPLGSTESSHGAAHVSRETSRSTGADRAGGVRDRATSVRDRAGNGPGRATTGPGRGRAVRRRRSTVALGTAFGVAVIGAGVFMLQSSGTSSDPVAAETPSARVTATAGDADDFSGGALEPQVDALLGTASATSGTSPHSNPDLRTTSTTSTTASNAPLMESVPQVPYCVRQGTGRTEAVIAAQQGTYRGTPAYLLVLANPADETKVRVYVIDASCVGAAPTVKGKILQTDLYPRR